MVFLIAIPVLHALVASVMVAGFAWRWRYRDQRDEVLPKVVQNWGSNPEDGNGNGSMPSKRPSKGHEWRSLCDGEVSSRAVREDSGPSTAIYSERHEVNGVVIVQRGPQSRRSRVVLPAELKPDITSKKLRGSLARAPSTGNATPRALRKSRTLTDLQNDKRSQFPVPTSLLFAPVLDDDEQVKASTSPLAAVVSWDDGVLLYEESDGNARGLADNPRTWQDALRDFLVGAPQFYQEARDLIQGHLYEFEYGADRPLILLEIEADIKPQSGS
jgi:hypothetical protein